jgi:hypothetical protein
MNIEVVKEKIESFIAADEVKLLAVIEQLLKLYTDIRISNTNLEENGDMLLFQWGTYDWGEGNYFEFDITRQVISPDLETEESEEGIKQLKVTFKYLPTPSSKKLKSGNIWCENPSELSKFKSIILESSSYQWCSNEKPVSVIVDLDVV